MGITIKVQGPRNGRYRDERKEGKNRRSWKSRGVKRDETHPCGGKKNNFWRPPFEEERISRPAALPYHLAKTPANHLVSNGWWMAARQGPQKSKNISLSLHAGSAINDGHKLTGKLKDNVVMTRLLLCVACVIRVYDACRSTRINRW